jgi:hypothetical protein
MASSSKVEHYRRLNGKYLHEAEELLAKKDYPQASEKFWGAAAEIIKAVAAKKGITLGTHRSLAEYVEKLQEEHPKLDLARAFDAAEGLHINFYEDHLPEATVKRRAEAVREFVKRMEQLL